MSKKYTSLLWSNNKKNPNAPDYKGEIEIDGNKLQAAAWIKIAKNNSKYLSLNIEDNNFIKKINQSKTPEKNISSKNKNDSKLNAIKRIETLSTKNVKTSLEMSKVNSSHKVNLQKNKRSSIFINNDDTSYSNTINKKKPKPLKTVVGGGSTKKIPPKYARYIDESFGSRSDFIKDRKRSGK